MTGAVTALAGCSGNGDGGDDGGDGATPTETATPTEDGGTGTAVTAGPGGDLVFDPDQVTISVGETVTWEFASTGHNVSARPEHNDQISIPDGAEPFASYEGDNQFDTVPSGETFEHTFETAGEYTYVCIPHVSTGMVGTVVVEE